MTSIPPDHDAVLFALGATGPEIVLDHARGGAGVERWALVARTHTLRATASGTPLGLVDGHRRAHAGVVEMGEPALARVSEPASTVAGHALDAEQTTHLAEDTAECRAGVDEHCDALPGAGLSGAHGVSALVHEVRWQSHSTRATIIGPTGGADLYEPMDIPPICNDTVYLGVYLDAASEGPGATDERLTALALLPFSFDIDAWKIAPRVDEALSGPEPQRVTATGGDARAPGIDLVGAGALIERAHLIVTHTPNFARALLDQVLPAVRKVPWLEWWLDVAGVDETVHGLHAASGGLAACESGLWLLAQRDAGTGRPMLSLLLAQSADATRTPTLAQPRH